MSTTLSRVHNLREQRWERKKLFVRRGLVRAGIIPCGIWRIPWAPYWDAIEVAFYCNSGLLITVLCDGRSTAPQIVERVKASEGLPTPDGAAPGTMPADTAPAPRATRTPPE